MVPYVRKSFWKHYKDGLRYIELQLDTTFSDEAEEIYEILQEDWSEKSIDSSEYKKFNHAYDYATNMTIKETQQAVEGMYHNLKY